MIYLNGTSSVSASRNKEYSSEVFQTPLAVPRFSKVAGRSLKACKLTKTRVRHGCFFVIFLKIFRTSFFTEHLRAALSIFFK